MSILDLGPVIFSSVEEQIEWFQRHSFTSRECPACHFDMEMQLRSDIQEKYT